MPKELFKHEKMLRKFALHVQKGLEATAAVNKQELPAGLVSMVNIIPPGKSGNVRLEHYTATAQGSALFNLRSAINHKPETAIIPGNYVRLIVGPHLMMSDTPFEARTNRDIIEAARGDVLIAGLGMGMVLVPILRNPKVTSVTVVELSSDVIKLVHKPLLANGPFTENEKMKLVVVEGDIFDFTPMPKRFDVIYFDIWPTIAKDNLSEGRALKKQYRKSLRPGGWMKVWVEDDMLKLERDDKALDKRMKAFRQRMKEKKP